MNTSHKPNTPQPYTLTTADIQAMFELPATALADLLRKHPDSFMPHLEALKTGILATYGRYESADLLKTLDTEILAYGLQQAIEVEPLPVDASPPPKAPPDVDTDTVSAGDGDLVRTALGLKHGRQIQTWLMTREVVRAAGGKDYVLRRDLPDLLATYHIKCSHRTLDRWLEDGNGLYWTITRKRIRITGYRKLAKRLTRLAHEKGLPDLVSTNRPGAIRPMYIELASDSLAEFEANVYAAWLASRNNPAIKRETLKKLFNRDLNVLLEWEQLAQINVIHRWGHIPTEFSNRVPTNEQGEFREDVHEYQADGRTRWKVQLSNVYHVPAIKQHPKRGQSRRVKREIDELLESDNPAGNYEQGGLGDTKSTGGLERLDKMYFEDSPKQTAAAKAQNAYERGKLNDKWLFLGCDRRNEFQLVLAVDGIQRATLADCLPKRAGWVNYA